MEHLLSDGEGNYVNLRHVSVLATTTCMATDCQCAGQDGFHVVASIAGRRSLFVLNARALPTLAAAQVLLERQLAHSVDPPWAARVSVAGDGG